MLALLGVAFCPCCIAVQGPCRYIYFHLCVLYFCARSTCCFTWACCISLQTVLKLHVIKLPGFVVVLCVCIFLCLCLPPFRSVPPSLSLCVSSLSPSLPPSHVDLLTVYWTVTKCVRQSRRACWHGELRLSNSDHRKDCKEKRQLSWPLPWTPWRSPGLWQALPRCPPQPFVRRPLPTAAPTSARGEHLEHTRPRRISTVRGLNTQWAKRESMCKTFSASNDF